VNITDIFVNNNGQLNWDAISTISNFVLVAFLVIITLWSVIQIKKQTKFMEIDRYVREMDHLVAPLFSKKLDKKIFTENRIQRINNSNRSGEGVKKYYYFWDDIKQNKYLGSTELRLALDHYFKIKIDVSDEIIDDESHTKEVETELFNAIDKRYCELETCISISREKVC